MDGGDVPGRAVERRRDGGEHPRELPLGHWPGSMLDRSSVRPAGPSAGGGAAGGGGGARGDGRGHRWTPVTSLFRIPSFSLKKKKNRHHALHLVSGVHEDQPRAGSLCEL